MVMGEVFEDEVEEYSDECGEDTFSILEEGGNGSEVMPCLVRGSGVWE